MDIGIGILLGSIVGVLLTLVPGFNIGLGYILAPLIPNPRFAIGVIIGADLTHSSLSHLSLLHSKHREDLDEDITGSSNKEAVCITSAYAYCSIKLISCWALAIIIMLRANNILDLEITGRQLALIGGVVLWVALISLSKHWIIATIAFLGYVGFSLATIGMPVQEPMMLVASSVFSANLINNLRYKSEVVDLGEETQTTEWNLSGVIPGILSGFLWGLPTNAVCKLLENEDESANSKISRHAVADAVASSLGLALLLTIGGARTTSANYAANFQESFHYTEVAALLFTVGMLTGMIAFYWEPIMEKYSKVYNATPNVVKKLGTMVSIVMLVVLSKGWFMVTALCCLMLNKISRLAGAPRELSLSTIGILPTLNLVKF